MKSLMRLPRADHSAYQFLRLLRQKFVALRVMETAGSLTFTSLLSLVPMVTVVLGVMRQFTPFMQLGDSLRVFLLRNLLPEKAGKVIATYALQFSEKASSLTVVGTIFLVVTAIMLFSTIDRTINSVWQIRKPRAWFVRLPVYWLALTMGPLIFAAGISATSDLLHATLTQRNRFADHTMTALMLSALFTFLFHVVPNRRLVFWHALAGGLVAGVGVVLVQRLFGLYLTRLPNFTLIYGTFSVLPIFLIWVFLSWLLILLGATVAAVLPEFMMRRHLLPATAAGRAVAALRLAQALVLAQQTGRVCEVDALARACRQTPGEIEQMLGTMREAGWVLRSEDGAWALRVAGERLSQGALLTEVVMGIPRSALDAPGLSEADRQMLAACLDTLCADLPAPVLQAGTQSG